MNTAICGYRAWLCGFVLGCSLAQAQAPEPRLPAQVSLNIPSQAMDAALNEFSEQTGIQLIFPTREVTAELRAPALHGTYTLSSALDRLLADSGLSYSYVNDRTVAIRASKDRDADEEFKPAAAAAADGDTMRLAQAQQQVGGASGSQQPTPGESEEGAGLEEVLVTGTYIRGAAPVGSPLKIYSREDIDRSGAATVDQFARQMLENFSNVDPVAGQFSSASRFGAGGSGGNIFAGSSFNLRGIGAQATLTLLNGQRMAGAGISGGLIDTSLIPLSAIERIEVLSDGASAIYGADAVAGVVNMITRRDFEGVETSVRFSDTTDGGGAQRTASQALGTAWASGSVLLNYQYHDQEKLDASERSYLPSPGGPLLLVPENETHSVFLSARQSLGPRTGLSGQLLYGERAGFVRARDARTGVATDASFSLDVAQSSASLALEQGLFGDWTAELSGNYSHVPQDSVGRVVTTVGLTSLSDQSVTTKVLGADLLLNGTLVQMPAGALRAALGVTHRDEEFDSVFVNQSIFSGLPPFPATTSGVPDRDRRVKSAFAELSVPLLSGVDGSQRLMLSAAARYDDYSDFGSADTYKLGIAWSPMRGLHLRGTYGTSFRAPLLTDLWSPIFVDTGRVFPDPGSASGVADVLVVSGGNPALRPEESEAFTAGIDLEPAFAPNLRIAITYFDIDFTDKVGAATIQGLFTSNPVAAPFIDRSPSLAEVEALFATGTLRNPQLLTPAEIDLVFVGNQIQNLSSVRQSGVDLNASYQLDTARGEIDFTLAAAHFLENDNKLLPGQPTFDFRNNFAQPPKWKGRAGVSWTPGSFGASLFINHVNRYRSGLGATAANPAGSPLTIDSWTTADLQVSYRTSDSSAIGLLDNVKLALSISNLTDERPPHVEIPASVLLPGQYFLPFDAANASAVGRSIALQAAKRW